MAKQIKKITKKEFFEVNAPITATKLFLYGSSPKDLDGMIIKLDLTRSLRGKNLIMSLRVRHDDGQLIAEPVSFEVLGQFIRRMMRKGADYVEDSFVTECKDGNVLIKPFMITRNKVSRAIRKEIRNCARKYLQGYLKTRLIKELFSEMISNKIQKELSLKVKKVYPLALCEIRVFKIVK